MNPMSPCFWPGGNFQFVVQGKGTQTKTSGLTEKTGLTGLRRQGLAFRGLEEAKLVGTYEAEFMKKELQKSAEEYPGIFI